MGVEVTIVCRSYPLKFIDDDVRQELIINLNKQGIKLELQADINKVQY